jgi:hypothetical protein
MNSGLLRRLLWLRGEFSWWTRTLSREIRSLHGRICVLREKRKGLHPNDVGPLYREETSGLLSLSLETIARSTSIRDICATYRWVSAADVLLVLLGWDKGMEFALCTLGNKDMETETASRRPTP